MKQTLLGLLLVTGCVASAHANTVRDYMIRALDGGTVSGELHDSTARMWQLKSGSSAPVRIHVTKIKDYKQAGCGRLKVTLWQDGVPTKDGKQTTAAMPFEMNLCRDGSPPLEAVDVEAIQRQMRQLQEEAKNRMN